MKSLINFLLVASVIFIAQSHFAYAGGSIGSIITAVVVTIAIVAVAVATGGAAAALLFAVLPATAVTLVGSAIVLGVIATTFLVVGDCMPGSPAATDVNVFCPNSGSGSGGPSGGSSLPPTGLVAQSQGSATCDSYSLSIDPQGHNFSYSRDGVLIKYLTSSQGTFTDTGLTPHTNYSYVIRIPDPAESGVTSSDSAPFAAYTKCLPQCSFAVDNPNVAAYGTTNLRWKCIHNDPAVDSGSCVLTDSSRNLTQTVDSRSGTMEVSPSTTTAYTLKCTNIDGEISVPQNINIFEPGIKEVKP